MVRALLRLEGLVVCALAIYGYRTSGGSWLWLVLLFLTPDFSMVGYLASPGLGSLTYNIAHIYVTAAVFVALGWSFQVPWLLLAGFLLAAHIGVDRLLGFGLKYPGGFKDTHLQRV